MKVLYFHHASKQGGAPKSLALLIEKLTGHGVEPIIAMPARSYNTAVKNMFIAAGAQIIEHRDIRPFHGSTIAPNHRLAERGYALATYLPLLLAARSIVQQVCPDLVHLNSTCMVAAAHGSRLARPDLPMIAHVREPLLQNRWGRMLAAMNRRYVSHFISIDAAGDASLGADLHRREIIRNSADDPLFDLDAAASARHRAALGWPQDEVMFLYLSRVTPANGALELIQAFQAFRHGRTGWPGPAPRLVVAGFNETGLSEYETRALDLIKADPACTALPFSGDVLPLLAASDVVMAPYLTSHGSRSIFEGAAAGRPAIVAAHPNLMEQIEAGKTGISYPPGETQGLIGALAQMIAPQTRTAMGTAARVFALERHNSRNNALRVSETYHRLTRAK